MKKSTLVLLMLILCSSLFAGSRNCPVSVISTKRDIFYFRVNKIMVGAELEVFSSSGEMIFSGKVTHRKAMVDFYLENPGTFLIKLKMNQEVKEFTFIKSSPSPLEPVVMESANPEISLVQ